MQLRARSITVISIFAVLMLSAGAPAIASPPSEAGSEEASSSSLEPSIREEDEAAELLVEPDQETAPSQTTTTSMAPEKTAESTRTTTPSAPVPALRPTPPSPAPAATGPAAISVSPTSGPPGTAITVRGTNWTHETWSSGVPVQIFQNYGNGNLKRLADGHSGRPDSKGNFNIQMAIPSSAVSGLVTVAALTGGGGSSDALFTVTGEPAQDVQPPQQGVPAPATTVRLAPDPVEAGKSITITGRNFDPGNSVIINWCFGGSFPESPIVADDGTFSLTVMLPPDAPIGATCVNLPGNGEFDFTITPAADPVESDPDQHGALQQPDNGNGRIPGQDVQPPSQGGGAPNPPGQGGSPAQWVCLNAGGGCIDPATIPPERDWGPPPPGYLTSPVVGGCVLDLYPGGYLGRTAKHTETELLEELFVSGLGGAIRLNQEDNKLYVLLTTSMPYNDCFDVLRGAFQPVADNLIDEIKRDPLLYDVLRTGTPSLPLDVTERAIEGSDTPAALWWLVFGALLTVAPTLLLVRALRTTLKKRGS